MLSKRSTAGYDYMVMIQNKPIRCMAMFVSVVNNLNYRQRLNERVGPTLGYVSLERKQLAENSTVYVQFLDNQMLLKLY